MIDQRMVIGSARGTTLAVSREAQAAGASSPNLSIYQGDDASWVVSVYEDDGTDADLTGYVIKAQIRRNVADQDPVVAAEMVLVVVGNMITMSLHHSVTAALSGSYVWDLQLTSADDVVTTIINGKVKVTPEVTRETAP